LSFLSVEDHPISSSVKLKIKGKCRAKKMVQAASKPASAVPADATTKNML
jgi:hypothetical protein